MQVGDLPVTDLDDDALAKELRSRALGLTVDEARKLRDLLGRDPSSVEAALFDVMWSEHCSYKSSRGVLKLLPTEGSDVLLGPGEDAGIIRLVEHEGKSYCVVMAHESHNHPSQVLPVEGAATGIGGIVRDVYCMGAKVIGVMDALRFGDPGGPAGARSLEIAHGVVTGIWQYGNALGVPNLGGDVYFAPCYDENCLVNVVAVGIVQEDQIIRSRVPDQARTEPYDLLLIGKPTDQSGYKGASFASKVLEGEEEDKGAVQVPDPFLKRVLTEATARALETARSSGVPIGFKDLGAGGIACAFSEMAARGDFGADLDLSLVPIDGEKLPPEVIACSETQERYAMAVPRRITSRILDIYNKDYELPRLYPGAGATLIGSVVPDEARFTASFEGSPVCRSPVEAITAGVTANREARAPRRARRVGLPAEPERLDKSLLAVIGSLNACSREPIFSYYDWGVQGRTVVGPGEADASVVVPIRGCPVAVAVSVDGNPFYGAIDPYWGGATAVAESMRNVACVGAAPQALTDCLNFGNPEKPEVFWQFSQSVKGIADAACGLWRKGTDHEPVPVISGNVSFYNESGSGSAIHPSPVVACVASMQDYSRVVTMQVKSESSLLLLVGERRGELGGSAYLRAAAGGSRQAPASGPDFDAPVPTVDFQTERAAVHAVIDCIQSGLVLSCHDISEGGLAMCLAEMLIGPAGGGRLGCVVDTSALGTKLRADEVLFCEAGGFVLEVKPECKNDAFRLLREAGAPAWHIGTTAGDGRIRIVASGRKVVDLKVEALAASWTGSLREIW
jgi:phosphoribosylformylglycinamidine synthase II